MVFREMCEHLNGRYGFTPTDIRCLRECEDNPLIVPVLYRYQGMGLYEILAEVKDTPDKFFLFDVGGPNGHHVDMLHTELNNLTIDQALTLAEIMDRLTKRSWIEIAGTTMTEDGDAVIQTTHTRRPEEQQYLAEDEPHEYGSEDEMVIHDEPNSETETWEAPDSDVDYETIDEISARQSDLVDDSSDEDI